MLASRNKKFALLLICFFLASSMYSFSVDAQDGSALVVHQPTKPFIDQPQVQVEFTALDSTGQFASGIQPSDLALFVDGIMVTPTRLEIVPEPINLVIMIDTSKKLSENEEDKRFNDIRNQLIVQLNDLFPRDVQARVWLSIFTYSKELTTVVVGTSNFEQAFTDLRNYRFTTGSYPCFYASSMEVLTSDAIIAERPTIVLAVINGEKALPVFQEANKCPVLEQDFKDYWAVNFSPPTLYMVNYGEPIPGDAPLQELTFSTGGAYYNVYDPAAFPNRLSDLVGRLPKRYRLTYSAIDLPRSVSIEWNSLGLRNSWPTEIIGSPQQVRFIDFFDGQKVLPGSQFVSLDISQVPPTAQRLVLEFGNESEEKSIDPESGQVKMDINLENFQDKVIMMRARVYDQSGYEIASSPSISLAVNSSSILSQPSTGTPIPEVVPGEDVIVQTSAPASTAWVGIMIGVLVAFVLMLLVLVGFLLYKFSPRFKQLITKKVLPGLKRPLSFKPATKFNQKSNTGPGANLAEALYQLTILKSPQPSLVGRTLTISKEHFFIGRDPQNDLPLPGDRQVSRRHVLLVAKMGSVQLVEQGRSLPDGSKLSPAFGTYVDGKRISRDVRLYDGNLFSLGQRTIFSIKLEDLEK